MRRRAWHEQDGTRGWEQDPDGALSERNRWSYELTGNRGDRLDGADDYTSVVCPAWPTQLPCVAEIPPTTPPPPPPDYRGVRTVLVDTFVGAHLDLHGVLSILPQASTDARASADFLELGGFSVDLAPAPGFEGLELTFDLGSPPASLAVSDEVVTEGDAGSTARAAARFGPASAA
jgi:hypothetical protein